MEESIDFDFFDEDSAHSKQGDKLSGGAATTSNTSFSKNYKISSRRSVDSRSSSESSSSDESSTSNLHGTNDTASDYKVDESNRSEHRRSSQSSDETLHSQSHDSSSGTSTPEQQIGNHGDFYRSEDKQLTNNRKKKQITMSKSKRKSGKSDFRDGFGDGCSSDSVTDVSPLTSPDASPSVSPRHTKTSASNNLNESSGSDIHETHYRHITKLNVTFKPTLPDTRDKVEKSRSKSTDKKASTKARVDGKKRTTNYSDERLDSSNSSLDELSSDDQHSSKSGNSRSIFTKRQANASVDHRRRLLDSAARGSMDVSSLLETVLEFERQNYDRKVINQQRNPMNYRLGEKIVNYAEKNERKSMSFTNEQVREIDRENNRLLKQISKRSRPSSASSVRSSASISTNASMTSRASSRSTFSRASRSSTSRRREGEKPIKLYHSAINRLQKQRQIERENMQLLKRLNAAKPSLSLQRQRQLADHRRQKEYMGTTIERSGMTARRANELTRDAEIVKEVIGLRESRFKPVRPAWEGSW